MIEITCATTTGTHTRGMRAGAKIVSRASRATRGVVPFSRPYPPSPRGFDGIGESETALLHGPVAITCRTPPILNVLERDEILNLVRVGDFRSDGEKFNA